MLFRSYLFPVTSGVLRPERIWYALPNWQSVVPTRHHFFVFPALRLCRCDHFLLHFRHPSKSENFRGLSTRLNYYSTYGMEGQIFVTVNICRMSVFELEGTFYTGHTYPHIPCSSAEANLPKQTAGKSLPCISLQVFYNYLLIPSYTITRLISTMLSALNTIFP